MEGHPRQTRRTDESDELSVQRIRTSELYLCIAQILHLLCNPVCVRSEKVFVVSQHHILNDELTHSFQGNLLQVHLPTLHSEQAYVSAHQQDGVTSVVKHFC